MPSTRADGTRPPHQGAVLALYVAIWTSLAVISAGQGYLSVSANRERIPFPTLLAWELLVWYLWAVSTPLIALVARRWPFSRTLWWRPGLIHAACALAIVVAHTVVASLLKFAMRPDGSTETIAELMLDRLSFRLQTGVVIYAAILGILVAIERGRQLRARDVRAAQLEAELLSARLAALHAQLHPHFLFNALNTVAMLVRESGNRLALDVVVNLSQLLRRVVDRGDVREIPLAEEFDLVRCYLEIEQLRFADRLTVAIALDPAAADASVPPLILQPLVENALRHGIAHRVGAGRVGVNAHRDDRRLRIEVHDDGPGFEPGDPTDGRGTGLRNVRTRLALHYPDDHGFDVQSGRRGTVVRLDLPWRERRDANRLELLHAPAE